VAGADTLIVKALALGASDSVVVAVSKLSSLDTTISVTFRIETGAGSDSTALISPLPKLLLYGSPRPIAEMRANDITGVPIHLQRLVTVRGIVTVSNQFNSPAFIQDASGGIAVFDNAFVNAVRVGDEVSITGMVTQFNGLTELENVTLHHIHGSGNEILPTVVTASQIANDGVNGVELYEGMLVRLSGIVVRDTLGQQISVWSSAGSGSNFLLIDATDTITVRIDADTQIAGLSVPQGAFDIIGIVGQFSRGPVFTGGYQLQPRSRSDILSKGPLITSTPLESSITPTSLKISWETASAGSSFVRYGRTKSYELGIVGYASMATSHSVTMASLEPATVYNVQAFSVSGTDTSLSGNRVVSTSSQGSSGEIHVYFNKSVNSGLARSDTAKGNVNLPDRLLQRINNAQISIDVALYSISGSVGDTIANALVRAKNRGVKARLIIEKDNLGAGTGNTITQIITPAGIPWIADNFDGVNGGVGLHHNKFFVIDYADGSPDNTWVWTGSWNLTDPGTNDDMQNAIEIQDEALAGAYTVEFNEMWGSDGEAPIASNSRFGARKLDNTPHVFSINGTPVELYFSPSDRTTSAIIRTLNKAQNSVNVALLTFTRSDIAAALKAKKDSGMKVRALLDNDSDTGTQYGFLTGSGIEVRIDPSTAGLLHHKYAVIDAEVSGLQQYVITGSHNWTNAAENSNNENTLIIESNRIANQYLQEFAARYKESGGVDGITVSVEHVSAERPMNFWLSQNYPNPFNPETAISFQLSANSSVALRVFDVLGREVAVLVNEEKPAGVYRVAWDAASLPSGVYFYRLKAGSFVETKKMLLLR
jgi:phosphatidylserine/phosphatidylglycerophosphate/cardiolipin synthase-like enzyme